MVDNSPKEGGGSSVFDYMKGTCKFLSSKNYVLTDDRFVDIISNYYSGNLIMERIKNLKTERSYQQKQDFVNMLKAKRNMCLRNTDWTQLNDVHIENMQEVVEWRKSLRYFNIDDDSDESTEKELNSIILQKPDIILR